MRTENILLDYCSDRHFFEETIHTTEKRVLVIDVLLKLCSTFITKSLNPVDLSVLVRASEEDYVFWELNLECKKQEYSLYAL